MVWIRLPDLPVPLYKKGIVEAIDESIGPVIKLDYQTEWGRRGCFARMAITIDLSKPLVSKIIVNGKVQLIEYESLHVICFQCGKYGHAQEICPSMGNQAANSDLERSTAQLVGTCETPIHNQDPTTWEDIRASIAWSLVTGTFINPLDDNWISSLGPLRPYLLHDLTTLQVQQISDLLDNHGQWDVMKLSCMFNYDVIPHILSIRTPDESDMPDKPIWGLNAKNVFNIKSAYASLKSGTWEPESRCWKAIWSLQVPQHLRVWSHLLPPQHLVPFYYDDFCSWLISNVAITDMHPVLGIPWHLLFVSMLWKIWKNRNAWVFNGIMSIDADTVHRSITWARYYSECTFKAPSSQSPSRESTHWQRPELGWVSLCTDGAILATSGIGSAELWGIFVGLQITWDIGLERLLIQSDSKEAIKLLNDKDAASNHCALVRSIARLRNLRWETTIQWIPRTGNKPADMLAKFNNLPCYNTT
ncbi:hypothetical protein V6N11_019117 [Hibiscus sabdariffa]|uniref:CCHC-type domain-containing protein n=1 Tax=Hibiscus sabdariffa TaxID=183260 RepID=A0ABR2R1N1_9ROSI